MHELAIMESVVDAVTERVGDVKVVRVLLEIGKLSGVVPDALRFCFDLATAETPLEGAALEIVEIPGRARCLQCLADVDLEDQIALCVCGSANLDFLSGQELRIREVEVSSNV
ncbi:MAG TPA: hydrogenase maturation nickel metallochaperone HypA [Candidatus Dormibacteraeota bacterium]|jgi:hydrogenase nickel incorporation protein HypA/HybF|nr:hydrogenase maturation nickel metallochaperone HypA [Candidatus Dormibacteraeota bacterium]